MKQFPLMKILCLAAVLFGFLGILPAGMADGGAGTAKAFAFEQKPAEFVLLDQSGRVTRSDVAGFTDMVKMDYNRPRYNLQINSEKGVTAVEDMFRKTARPDKETVAAAAKEAGSPVLVVLVVKRMDMWRINYTPMWWDDDTAVHTYAYADIYAYNADGDKYIARHIRKNEIREEGMEEDPYETIKYGLGNALNRMEGKPPI